MEKANPWAITISIIAETEEINNTPACHSTIAQPYKNIMKK